MDLGEQHIIQSARRRAFDNGDYELSDEEGFTCTKCGWRGLSAPPADDWGDLDNFLACPECNGTTLETSDTETDWEQIREDVPDEYLE